jgi:hypothetical protein
MQMFIRSTGNNLNTWFVVRVACIHIGRAPALKWNPQAFGVRIASFPYKKQT